MRRSPIRNYGIALVALAVTTLLRWIAAPYLESHLLFGVYHPAVLIATFYGGVGPGIFATLAAIPLAELFEYDAEEYNFQLFLYLAVSALIVALVYKERQITQRFRLVVDANILGVIVATPDGTICEANDYYLNLLGYTREDFRAGKLRWTDMTPPEWIAADQKAIEELRTCGACTPYEKQYFRKDGSRIWVFLADVLLPGPQEQILAFVYDTTEKKQAQQTAEIASRVKSEFLANMSHEIRTPMTAILGMTELALEEDLSPTLRDGLETVKSSADALLSLINEILDFSRVESGRLALESVPFSFRATVNDTLKALGGRASEKGLSFRHEIDDDIPDNLFGDPFRLRQVLNNLVGNAIKFTERGSVRVRASRFDTHGSAVGVRLEVADTGIGIDEAQHREIFAPFTQADASTSRRFGGSGLGLAITSSLAKLMGGTVSVRSEPGEGSVFLVDLQFTQPDAATLAPSVRDLPAFQRQLNVLLVEDTPANQKLVLRILAGRGHHVTTANNGREAVALVAANDFDAVLMDIQMPVMDGMQATAAIRCLPSKERVPIIAMTAHAMKGDEERCLAAGMDCYIAKPINRHDLIQAVETLGAGLRMPGEC